VAHQRNIYHGLLAAGEDEDDPQAAEVEDAFLFGPDLLVAPIVEYQARAREVYLPAGADWTNAWTGESAPGGTRLVVDAPIEHIPVFVRSGRLALLSLFKGLYDD
jgi:alpha-D-xyloside xylohydrolase